MAVVYEIFIKGPEKDGVAEGLSEIELVDAVGDEDEWHTDQQARMGTIGAGSGTWFRRASRNQIFLLDEHTNTIEATLDIPHWPLKKGDQGSIVTRQPMTKGGKLANYFVVMRVL